MIGGRTTIKMSRYLEIAKGIHSWLHNLQVKPETITAEVVQGHIDFKLAHPVSGEIAVRHAAGQDVFSANGIALRPLSRSGERVTLEVVDGGGIYDPIDGRVQGEHYSTSHFALLSAILFQETQEESYLSAAKDAIAFHLRTSLSEYQPISEWMYHWDFQNYAFVLTYRLLEESLTPEERQQWKQGLNTWQTNHRNKLTNWAAMRAWAFAERHDLFGGPLDRLKAVWNLRYVARARSRDGCFDDNRRLSRPIQYHIFTVAILHRIHLLWNDTRVKKWFADGLEYFVPFIDPEGDFNYLGRGHEQIFGYGAAIYALEAGYKEKGDSSLLTLSGRLFDYLLRFQRGDHFPLVLNDRPDEERPGWYDYHHLTVYNAFLGAWLGLTHLLGNPPAKKTTASRTFSWISQPTETAVVSTETYFAVFFGGLPEYLCEPGITLQHLWWKDFGFVFSCPGGPTPDRFGKHSPDGSEKNLFAPIAQNGRGWIAPARRASVNFERNGDVVLMRYDCGPYELSRRVQFDRDAILFEDEITFLQELVFDEFRFFNFPVADKFKWESPDATQLKLVSNDRTLLFEFSENEMEFEELEIVCSARGRLHTVAKRSLNFRARKGDKRNMRFRISAAEAELAEIK
ncbi:MAG: hypothetical protein ACE5IY_06505 [bacterium]